MDVFVRQYWALRLTEIGLALKKNNFDVFLADNLDCAVTIFWENIFATSPASSVSWGDSLTLLATGLPNKLMNRPDIHVVNPFEQGISRGDMFERQRQALLVDLFLTGTNAVTEKGHLVNLDMVGNRVAGIAFGPKHVVVFIGRNKIVPDIEEAMFRIKDCAAPMNAIRHRINTPCVETSFCGDCNNPNRICNTWAITEKSFPKNRIKIILINQDLGF